MRCFFRWAVFSAVAASCAAVQAQQDYYPILSTYDRVGTPVSYGPAIPVESISTGTIGTGLGAPISDEAVGGEAVTIPQQGTVDFGRSGGSCTTCTHSRSRGLGLNLGNLLNRHRCGNSCGGWFGGLYYLHLWRDDDRFGVPLATTTGDPTNFVLSTGMAHMKDASGLGVRVGKMINPCTAIEGIYWQVFPDDNPAVAQNSFLGDTVDSTLSFAGLTYNGQPVDNFFQGSQYMRVNRTFDYRNFEINFLRLPYTFVGGSRHCTRLALLAGVRYFRADESLEFFSDDLNEIPGDDPANEVAYFNEVENHLVGFQVGGLLNYRLSQRLTGQFGTKVGIYNNHMTQVQEVFGGAGGATITAGPDAGQPFALRSKKDDVAFLGEFDAGLAYCVNSSWRIAGGYRVLTVSGYADSVNQIPTTFTSLATNGLIEDNNSLILHGVYVGAEYTW